MYDKKKNLKSCSVSSTTPVGMYRRIRTRKAVSSLDSVVRANDSLGEASVQRGHVLAMPGQRVART